MPPVLPCGPTHAGRQWATAQPSPDPPGPERGRSHLQAAFHRPGRHGHRRARAGRAATRVAELGGVGPASRQRQPQRGPRISPGHSTTRPSTWTPAGAVGPGAASTGSEASWAGRLRRDGPGRAGGCRPWPASRPPEPDPDHPHAQAHNGLHAYGAAVQGPAPSATPAVCLLDGLPSLSRSGVKGRCALMSARWAFGPPLDPPRPGWAGATGRPGRARSSARPAGTNAQEVSHEVRCRTGYHERSAQAAGAPATPPPAPSRRMDPASGTTNAPSAAEAAGP